jgi:DNA replication and repair protein RecF
LRITHVHLSDFRNYDSWELSPEQALTVLVGPNAAGKTNIIEAIQIVCTGSSFRNPRWPEVIRWGAPQATLTVDAEGEAVHADVTVSVDASGGRSWRVGGVTKRRAADATRFVPVVLFTPDDLVMVKGAAEQRRSSVDTLGDQISLTYAALRRNYARVIRQRNALLKDEAPDDQITPWDEQVISLGARLHVQRRRLVRRLAEAAAPVYRQLGAGEDLTVRVVERCGVGCNDPASDLDPVAVQDTLRSELNRRRRDERQRRVSLAGPHRDDVEFLVNGRSARSYGSQGQQRTIALAWKWAEVSVVRDVLARTPVLLLDDVMSELDERRRGALTDLVQRDVQTFVTTTTTGYFDPALLRAAQVVKVGG